MYRTSVKLAVAAALGVIAGCDQPPARVAAPSTSSLGSAALADDPLLQRIKAINASLAAQGLNIAIEAIEFYTIGLGRPSVRLHQAGDRWVPNDPRRLAQGIDITYLVDLSDGATASGLTSAQTQTAIDAALTTWDTGRPLRKVDVVKRTDTGADPDIFDFFFGFGGFGNPFLADIVHAGWLPRAFFEAVFGPGGGTGALAFSVSFVFVDSNGVPTDVNGDGYPDTALAEVYYNDNFGNPAGDRPGFPWVINLPLPGIDVQTVALHESGHGFGLGHFGAPPIALMNPAYRGILQNPLPPDNAGMFALWASWPNP
ncbi:MAG: matrixin family metalloprotease [Gemmatimonadaceae bacterium]